jgi:hypothetical protein
MIGPYKLVEREKLCCGRVNAGNCVERRHLSRKHVMTAPGRRRLAIQGVASGHRTSGALPRVPML